MRLKIFTTLLILMFSVTLIYSQAPLPVTPGNLQTGVAITTDITWTDFTNISGPPPSPGLYTLQFFTDGTFTVPLGPPIGPVPAGGGTTTVLNATITGVMGPFANNTTYYWEVVDIDDTIPTPYKYSFTTVLATPTLTNPANGSSFSYTDPVNFNWTMTGIYSNVDFQVTVATDAGFTNNVQLSPVVSGVLTTSISIPTATVYYWKLDGVVTGAVPNVGETVSVGAAGTPSFQLTLPGPSLTGPVNGLTGVSIEPTMIWGSVTGATSYKLYIDDADDGWGTPLYEVDQGSNLTFSFNETIANFPLTNNTMYYWKVAAVDLLGNEFPSSTYHFTTVPTITVYQTDPGDGVLVYDVSADLSWYITQPIGTMQFEVQFVRDDLIGLPGTEPTAVDWNTLATSSTVTDITENITVLAGKTYWWRIIVLNAGNEVISYSSAWHFDVIGGANIAITQTWPTDNPIVFDLTPDVYWHPDQYALGVTYTVWYNTAGDDEGVPDGHIDTDDTGSIAVAAGTDISVTLAPALSYGIQYYWSVEATYNGESAFSGIEDFTTYVAIPLAVPIATHPIDGVDVYTTAPEVNYFTGTDVSGAYFDLDIYIGSGNEDGVANFWTTTAGDLSIDVTGLTPGVTYYYRLRTKNGNAVPPAVDASAWSDEEYFSVVGSVANGYPVATWPVGTEAPIVYSRNPELNWYLEGQSLGVTGYVVKYSNNPAASGWNSATWEAFSPGAENADDGETTIGDINTTTHTITADLTYGTTYYWGVASTGTGGESDYSNGSFIIYGGSAAVAPTLTLPNDATTINDRSPTLYWFINGSTVGFISYTITYSTSDVFAAAVTTTTAPQTASFLDLTNLTPGATYHWYVTANYTQGSAQSTTWTFTVDPGASSVQPLIGGPNNVSIGTVSPTIAWALPALSSSVLTYELEIADNPSFTNSMLYEGLSNPYHTVDGLHEGSDYYWKARSSTAAGDVSNYSPVATFKVVNGNILDVDDKGIIPNNFNVTQNYPNPFNPATTFTYTLPEASFVSIIIYDLLGREVKTLIYNDMNAGVHSVNWKGDDNLGIKVSSGTYIYRVVAGSNVVTKKMVLLK